MKSFDVFREFVRLVHNVETNLALLERNPLQNHEGYRQTLEQVRRISFRSLSTPRRSALRPMLIFQDKALVV